MKVLALFFMGLALVGVASFNVVAGDQDQDNDHQVKPHQRLNHPASAEVKEILDEEEYSQLLIYLKNVNTGRERRETPLINEVKTFYEIPIGSDYEVRFNFSVNPVPIAPFWTHGPKVIQIGYLPRDIGRFTTSMIYYKNDSYQTVLRITGVTANDIETEFDLHITNGISEAVYKIILSELPGPPSSVQISDIMPEAVSLSWEYNFMPGNISSYVIQYKPRHTKQDYNETVNIQKMFYTIEGLISSTEYAFRVLAVNQFGRGLPSENAYSKTINTAVEADDLPVTSTKPTVATTSKEAIQQPTMDCGGKFNSSSGMVNHPIDGGNYQNNEACYWTIYSTERIIIHFSHLDTEKKKDLIRIVELVNNDLDIIKQLSGDVLPHSIRTTTHSVIVYFESDDSTTATGFKLTWEPSDCGGDYNTSSGMIRHPLSGGNYPNGDRCTWIIRSTENMLLHMVKFDIGHKIDKLYIRDGVTTDGHILKIYNGSLSADNVLTTTLTSEVNIIFTAGFYSAPGFVLYWEPAVEIFYQIPFGNDYEVRINFSVPPGPTFIEWSYGSDFQETPNNIQIPSDNEKYSNSFIDFQNYNIQAVLRINRVTQDDFETKFKFQVSNGIVKTDYRAVLSAFSSVQISFILGTKVQVSWDYNESFGNISYYIIQYKPRNTNQDYTEITGIDKKQATVTGLTPYTGYALRVLALDKFGLGPASETTYFTTSCGGEFNSSNGMIHHPFSGENYQNFENCTWIIRSAGPIHITFFNFDTEDIWDNLYIRDEVSRDAKILLHLNGLFKPHQVSSQVVTTTNTAYLRFESNSHDPSTGFELHWKPAEIIQAVNANESLQLECGTEGPYRFCTWEKDTQIFQVEDVYNGMHSGLERPNATDGNNCNIVVSQASTRDHGIWICNVYIPKSKYALISIQKVVLTVAPTPAEVSPQQVTVNNGERAFLKCIVKSARPAASISWTLNDRNIASHAEILKTPTNSEGSYMTESTLSIIFNITGNGKMLKCVVTHHAMAEPDIVALPITVFGFDPIQLHGEVYIYYNISIGSEYHIRFKFSASPAITSIKWYYGSNFQDRSNVILIPSENTTNAASFILLDHGKYEAILKISSLREEDIKTKFTLHMENGKGHANYRVMLSMNDSPFECSEGFVMSYDVKHCYKIFRDVERNFTDAQKKCKEEGLMTVQLYDEEAADVRNMLLDNYGDGPVWIDARGNNHTFVWNNDQTEIKNGSLWWPDMPRDLMSGPGHRVTTHHCLIFLVYITNWKAHPEKPYRPFLCDRKLWSLCEGDSPKPQKDASITSASPQIDHYCSGGWFFTSGGSSKCFVVFKDRLRNWQEGKEKCENEGLLTAKPTSGREAIDLRLHLLDKYGDGRVWMGARANGTHYIWEQDRSELSKGSSLWQVHKNRGPWDDCHSHLGPRCGRTTPNHCLTLRVARSEWSVGPERPYASYECSTNQFTLCEHKGCGPGGFFSLDGSNQCFKLFSEAQLSWKDGASRCRDEGLRLAQPLDETAVALRKYILDTIGGFEVWLGARRPTPVDEVMWGDLKIPTDSSMIIPRNSSLFAENVGPDDHKFDWANDLCLMMGVDKVVLEQWPDQPYGLFPCVIRRVFLCEAVDPELE